VIFTLPDDRRGLWLGSVKPMRELLFAAVRHTVFALLEDAKYLGGRPGMIAALHTWSQTLVLHPHLHCLVTGGELSAAGQWRGVRNGFLLPVRVVKAVFRGKLLAALDTAVQAGRLTLPEGMTMAQGATLRNKLGCTKWHVHIRERYPHGGGVLTYLARYLRGGPLANTRLVSLGPEGVTFRYRVNGEGAASPRRGLMTLSLEDFLRRYLLHVPVPGSRVVRAYGLYAPTKGDDLAVCRAPLGSVSVATPVELAGSADGSVPSALEPERCPVCGRRLLRCGVILPTGRPPPDVRPSTTVVTTWLGCHDPR
jgi:Putative transposase